MEYLKIIFSFIIQACSSTFYQLVAIFGFVVFFGLILYFISRSTRKAFVNSNLSKLDIFLTGWIGTPVHELGHALFCVLFGHRITGIKLFTPNSIDGSLGSVNHTYDSHSFYQRIGNFFIGIAPIFFGSFIIYGLMYFCLPNYTEVSRFMEMNKFEGSGIFKLVKSAGHAFTFGSSLVLLVFSAGNMSAFAFWLFVYLSFCISSHMQLSLPDLKSMWSGFIVIVLIFVFANLIAQLFEFNITNYIFQYSRFLSALNGIFILSIVISLVNFLVSYFILALIFYLKQHRLLSIF